MERSFLLLFFCGCQASPVSVGRAGECTLSSDCVSGVCVDGMCRTQSDGGRLQDAGTDAGPLCQPCGEECCSEAQTCTDNGCVVSCPGPTEPCFNQAGGVQCCGGNEICFAGDCVEREPCENEFECGGSELCDLALGSCLPEPAVDECLAERPASELEVEELWSWVGDSMVLPRHHQILMTPVVANLNDDNGDGLITQRDIPDVIFTSFEEYGTSAEGLSDGVLRAISGKDGSRLWPTPGDVPSYRLLATRQLAVGDVDLTAPPDIDPRSLGPEIVACALSPLGAGEPILIGADGRELRRFPPPAGFTQATCSVNPLLADLDADGQPEIVTSNAILNADGSYRANLPGAAWRSAADIDGDGFLEVLGGGTVHEIDGTVIWDRSADLGSGWAHAIADLTGNGQPEVVVVRNGSFMGGHVHDVVALNGQSGATIWGPHDINPAELMAEWMASPVGGGPPTIANFDDDPEPEIALAGGYAYVVFDHDGTRNWFQTTDDRSSRRTGSSIFDFNGDGRAEVLYNDEYFLRIYRGSDGAVLFEEPNTTGTSEEYPIVVDVNNDGEAEIVVIANDYRPGCTPATCNHGIRVFGSPGNWVGTRRIWNQHSYHITNVNEDGSIPVHEERNWEVGFNNFRQNQLPQPGAAADLVPIDLLTDLGGCPEQVQATMRIQNVGAVSAPPGVHVDLFRVRATERELLGSAVTTAPLLPLATVDLTIEETFSLEPPSYREQLEVVIEDPTRWPESRLVECREDNNAFGPIEIECNFG